MEKWQEALTHWDKWKESISQSRESIQAKYGNIDDLLANAKFTLEVGEEDDNPTFNMDMNAEEEAIREIVDETRKFAQKFILRNIGIDLESFQFHVFQTWWLKSAFPSLSDRFELEPNLEEEEMATPWYSPKVIKADDKSKRVIIDRICWYRKAVEPADIIQLLRRIWRGNDEAILRRGSGGPRPKDKHDLEYPEGIVCHILKHKQKLSEVDIASIFDWSTYKDQENYEKTKCTTFRNRMRQARKLIDMRVMKSK
ncbi:hypothetical protein ACFLVI_03605 [Chloroflexota bacterium]